MDGDRAALLYDCELPAPVGVLRIAAFFLVENGKIRAYDTRLDATDLRKALAGPSLASEPGSPARSRRCPCSAGCIITTAP